jgi:hypothetical protein
MPDCKGLRCAQLSHIASTSAAANNTERTKTTVVPKDLAKSTTKSAITGMNSIGDATTLTPASEISITASVVLLAMHPHIFAGKMLSVAVKKKMTSSLSLGGSNTMAHGNTGYEHIDTATLIDKHTTARNEQTLIEKELHKRRIFGVYALPASGVCGGGVDQSRCIAVFSSEESAFSFSEKKTRCIYPTAGSDVRCITHRDIPLDVKIDDDDIKTAIGRLRVHSERLQKSKQGLLFY